MENLFLWILSIPYAINLEEQTMVGVAIKQRRHHLHYHQNAIMVLIRALEHYFTKPTVLESLIIGRRISAPVSLQYSLGNPRKTVGICI